MTTLQALETFEALCRDGATFEQALAETGLGDTPISMTAMLFRYWRVLEMEHAFEAARDFYDRYIELEDTP